MSQIETNAQLFEAFDTWLEDQIRYLSVDTLKSSAITCTACGEVAGDYIIDYQGATYRFPAPKAYAFLQFIAAQA